MPDEIIAAIKANPNIPMVSDEDIYQLIQAGKLDRDEIIKALVEPRRSRILKMLGDAQLHDRMGERFVKIQEGIGITMEDMRSFITDYPGTPEASLVQSMIEKKKEQDEKSRYAACQTLSDCKQFKIDYPNSPYILDIDKRIQAYADKDDEAYRDIRNSAGTELRIKLEAYMANPNFVKHTEEVRIALDQLNREIFIREEKKDWEDAIRQATNLGDIKLLSEFVNDHAHDTFLNEIEPNTDIIRRKYAEDIINNIGDLSTIQQTIDNVFNSPDSDVDNYVYLMQKYPMMREHILARMIDDMKSHAERYQRHEIYALLFGGKLIFSDKGYKEESISPSDLKGVLTDKQLNWIYSHPTIQADYKENELPIPIEDNFKVEANTTDVYFFGVPGCGKTSVLAGLFKAHKIDENLTFSLLVHSTHKGYNYANSLTTSLNNDLFPKSTPVINQRAGESDGADDNDDKFIQVIDAELTEKEKDTQHIHKISLIEMPGARTNELASIGSVENLDVLGIGAKELLTNANNKIIFFVIDPRNTKKQSVNINGSTVMLNQATTLNTVATLIKNMLINNQIQNLKAVHVIIAKGDLLPGQSKEDIKSVLEKGNYSAFWDTLSDICLPSIGEVNIHCNRQPHVFTFSLGHIAPGDFVKYSDKDTKKILKVICANTMSVRSRNFWDTVMTWMN